MAGKYNLRRSTRVNKLKSQSWNGSPKDQIARVPVILEELDLATPYVGSNQVYRKQKTQQRRKSWTKWAKKKPLTDPSKLPKGWHMNENDLEIDDIEGQIKRCHERIAENIMPNIFRQRLRAYNLAKQENDYEKDLSSTRGPLKQVRNINSILEAYRSKKLIWTPGSITYWSNGVQICEPRAFDWDEFETINSKYQKDGTFWTEGLKLAIRVPNVPWFAELDFIHDTGCSMMGIYRDDIETIMGSYANDEEYKPPILGQHRARSSNGEFRIRDTIEIEVTILDQDRQRMTAWTRVPCAINEGTWTPKSVPRLDGPILRDLMYTATAPDAQRLFYLANTTADLMNAIPVLDLANNPPTLPDTSTAAIKLNTKTGTKRASGQQSKVQRPTKTMPRAAPGAPPSAPGS
ncbi:hypothetical protein N7541_000432 [Penicillium brevicompactum]|uniref:Uncharacterized protein n=1 Tax=Penicillium brevicompactum TaxID=5074 RepID=A0A9W9V513_PENBR|nr:hypothetical protein N7541_000432 [Penicillium brevicompactum]